MQHHAQKQLVTIVMVLATPVEVQLLAQKQLADVMLLATPAPVEQLLSHEMGGLLLLRQLDHEPLLLLAAAGSWICLWQQ